MLTAATWLPTFSRDYLDGFVREGGSTVKVVVARDATRRSVASSLLRRGQQRGYSVALVDSRSVKVHLVDQLVKHVAAGLDWDRLATGYMVTSLKNFGLAVPEDGALSIDTLARLNGLDRISAEASAEQILGETVRRDFTLPRDFRVAASRMCGSRLGLYPPYDAAVVHEWLTGSLSRISTIRHLGVYEHINRQNARHMLGAFAAWARRCGSTGLMVVADLSQYLEIGGWKQGINRYTKLATLDLYEAVREFIDGAGEVEGLVIVFLTDRRFVWDEHRGMRLYEALRLRVTNDVEAKSWPNPLATMVVLEDG
jgi:hypothetical protein